jgi:hypothetical protein
MCLKESARQKVVPLVPVITRVLDTSPDITAQVHALGLLGILSSVPEVANGLIDYVRFKSKLPLYVEFRLKFSFIRGFASDSLRSSQENLIQI